jgi:NhaP-type Na+/H+ or K+/H+ antiporter
MRFARFAVPPLLLEVSLLIALVLVVLGPVTDFEPALYITAVVLLLFEDALYLAQLVYSQGPATA